MSLWSRCLQHLQTEYPATDIDTWLRPLRDESDGQSLLLFAPNRFVFDEVNATYLARIEQVLAHLGFDGKLQLEIDRGQPNSSGATAGSARSAKPAQTAHASATFQSNLDSHYSFENFVEGRSNQLARAAAWDTALHPGERRHNPLLLYGSTGLGKTHLMHAAGNHMRKNNPKAKVLYLSSRDFLDAFRKALYDKSSPGMDAFIGQFQGIDALLIDDIQFFGGKDRTQEEFFHTFNMLFSGHQQIILTCDRLPREVEGLEERLRSRLTSGLAVVIDPPDFETRAQILLTKAQECNAAMPEDVADLIAKRIPSNVRALEGALNTLIAQSRFTGAPITLEFAKETLRDLLRSQQRNLSIANIQKTVADYYGISLKDMLTNSRSRSITVPRHMAMALSKELTAHSLPEIGRAFERDHTSVLHACRKIQKDIVIDGKVRENWDTLLRKLSE